MTPPTAGSPIARRREVAAALRKARVAAGRTLDHAARALDCSPAKISRIETAQVRPHPRDARDLAAYYGLDQAEQDRMAGLARLARGGGWWDEYADMLPDAFVTYLGLEDEAVELLSWEPSLIPGLLQTPGYARAVMSVSRAHGPAAVERGLALRMARQAVLERPGGGPRLDVVVDESALLRPAGGTRVWAAQVDALASPPRGVTVRVLPLAAGPAAQGCEGFIAARSAEPDSRVVYTESLGDARLVDDPVRVAGYADRWAEIAGAALAPEVSAGLIRRVGSAAYVRGIAPQ